MRTMFLVVLAMQGCAAPECLDAPTGPVRLDFPDTTIGEKVLTLVQVTNTCPDPLAVQSLTIDGDDAFVIDEGPDTLGAMKDSPMAIAFTTDSYVGRVADLVLETANGPYEAVLTGRADPDQDGDGVNAVQAGGDDCDDNNPAIVGPTEEIVNGKDDDCDGLVDEGFVTTGEVVITELMLSPAAVTADVGQWVELRNETTRALDLSGWTLSGPAGVVTIAPGVRISGRSTIVLGFEDDTALNGGVELDGLLLGDGAPFPTQAWFLTLASGGQAVAVLSDNRWPEEAGSSIVLDPLIDNPAEATRAASWCVSTTVQPSGDRGTPGAKNDICPQFDHDGDGLSGLEGDCDDTNPNVSPIAADIWDGLDNNCDGIIDLLLAPAAANGAVQGNSDQFGSDGQLYDYDGDGAVDVLMVGTSFGGGSSTRVYNIPGAALISDLPIVLNDVMAGRVYEPNGGGAITGIAPPMDADDDGDDDLVVLGRAPNFYSGSTSFDYLWVYEGLPDDTSADLTKGEALIIVNDPKDGMGSDGVEALADLDMDGDGVMDAVFGHGSWKGSIANNDAICRGKVWLLDMGGVSGRVEGVDLAWAAWTGELDYASIGDSLSGGDMDDDGYDDVIIMDVDRQRLLDERRVQVIPGGTSMPLDGTFEGVTPLTITGLAKTANNAADVQAPLLADLDEDGDLDLAIPDPTGVGLIIFHDASTLTGTVAAADADLILSGPGGFGTEVAFGDVGGDGVMDLLVGAPTNTNASSNGRAYLYSSALLGGTGTVTSDAATVSFGTTGSGNFGARVKLGDLNGDGSDEVVVPDSGSYGFNGGVFVFAAPE